MATYLTYKGYTAEIEYRPDDQLLFGRVLDLADTVIFETPHAAEVEAAFHGAVDDYLAFCQEVGDEPDKPFSGRLNVRMPPDLHRAATVAAARENESLNGFIAHAVQDRVQKSLGEEARSAGTSAQRGGSSAATRRRKRTTSTSARGGQKRV